MAEVAEVVNDVQTVEKEVGDKKAAAAAAAAAAAEAEDGKTDNKKEKDANPKENGRAETNEKEAETNGSTEATEVTQATKRKSGAGDAPDGTPAESATPEKKAKISNDENNKEKDSTNGESEAASEGAAVTTPNNRSYQKH